MNWTTIISDLKTHYGSLEAIGQAVGLTKSTLSDLGRGLATTNYEAGCKLVDLHKKVMRKVARRAAK